MNCCERCQTTATRLFARRPDTRPTAIEQWCLWCSIYAPSKKAVGHEVEVIPAKYPQVQTKLF